MTIVRRPPRFAQTVGLVITGACVLLGWFGISWAVEVSAGLAFVAAILNAAIGLCLRCERYLLFARVRTRPA
jgi:Domain of unknown function (DUF4395)